MKVCRVCLVQDHQEQEQELRLQFESVFAVREERTVAEIIMLCTGVQITPNDALTQLVCSPCATEFLHFFHLRQKCLEADAFLRENQQHLQTFGGDHVVYSSKEDDATMVTHDQVQVEVGDDDADGEEEYKIELLDVDLEDEFGKADPDEVPVEEDWVVVSEVEVVKAELQECRARRRPRKRRKVFGVGRQPDGKVYCCSCPAEEFDGQVELELHRDAEHLKYRIADNVIRPFECDICFQRFLTERHLEQHKTRPYKKREYVCTSCGNAFLASNTLKKHEEICVTTERNYACEECGKRFTQVGSLRNHQKLHTTPKSYSCPICAKTFLKKFEVPIHMVTHTEEQPFPCDQCPARFKRKQALRNHQRHHANPTPYKCDLCNEWFNNFSARKYHRQKIHEGLDPFRCDQCGASYGRRNRLEQHVRRAHAGAS